VAPPALRNARDLTHVLGWEGPMEPDWWLFAGSIDNWLKGIGGGSRNEFRGPEQGGGRGRGGSPPQTPPATKAPQPPPTSTTPAMAPPQLPAATTQASSQQPRPEPPPQPCAVPETPAGYSIDQNISQAQAATTVYTAPGTLLAWFYSMVKPGGPWDYEGCRKNP
jgi:hypothetical protein